MKTTYLSLATSVLLYVCAAGFNVLSASPVDASRLAGEPDTHIYEGTGSPAAIRKVGTMVGNKYDKDAAWLCTDGRNCQSVMCSACHTKPSAAMTSASARNHVERYYPKAKFTLAAGQSIDFAGMKLREAAGGMEFVERTGRRHRLPADARLLKDRSGRPTLLMVAGSTLGLTPVTAR